MVGSTRDAYTQRRLTLSKGAGAPVERRRETGSLEQEVLLQLWALGEPSTPGEVLDAMGDDLAYTTVMTILTRLWQKGLVTRARSGRAYAYEPVVSEAELTARRMRASLDSASDPKAALVTFVGSLTPQQARQLRGLLGEAQKRRRSS
jgi:predicted transcriptional regulator